MSGALFLENTDAKEVSYHLKKQNRTHFQKQWIWCVISSAVLLLSVILILLFPREEHVVLSTVFAVLFWLSLVATIVSAAFAVRNRGKPPHDQTYKREKTPDSEKEN